LGGSGFELGDGALNYRREKILEMYYTCHAWKGAYIGPDFQVIKDPGYNHDRSGPVLVVSVRFHSEF
jgi:carbohydrate-selective porin OprB